MAAWANHRCVSVTIGLSMLSPTVYLLLIHEALAIPLQMNHQGRLHDTDGNGLTGSHELVFQMFDAPENGDEIWSEIQTVNFINGYYSVLLGADEINNPLASIATCADGSLKRLKNDTLAKEHVALLTKYLQLINEEDNLPLGPLNLFHGCFESFFKFTTKATPSDHGP